MAFTVALCSLGTLTSRPTHTSSSTLIFCTSLSKVGSSSKPIIRADGLIAFYYTPGAYKDITIIKLFLPYLLSDVCGGSKAKYQWMMNGLAERFVLFSTVIPCAIDAAHSHARRLACMPIWPGQRRFKGGIEWNQWTNDDTKALMRVRVCFRAKILCPTRTH
jgi:hypothetical protein